MTKQVDMQFDGSPIRRALILKGWNQTRLARAVGKSDGTISLILSSKCSNPKTVAEICEVLGIDVSVCYPAMTPPPTGGGPGGKPISSEQSSISSGHGPKGQASRVPAAKTIPFPKALRRAIA